MIYRKTSNRRRTLFGNKFVDHSDVDGASPVGAAPTTSFSTEQLAPKDCSKTTTRQDGRVLVMGALYIRDLTAYCSPQLSGLLLTL